jgi:glyceraldehyde 3-phosphate dehydrogenase
VVDLTFMPSRQTSVEEISEAVIAAADGPMQGVLGYHREPLVSVDFNGDSHSSTVDLSATKVLEGRLVRVASWYDNEWGFSCRMNDVAALLGGL